MNTIKNYNILTINTGSTSTKIGIFKDETLLFERNIPHNDREIGEIKGVWNQYKFRKKAILDTLSKENFNIANLDCVVGRGGLIQPTVSGTYKINKQMLQDARQAVQGEHASNLGCVLAYGIAWDYNIPSFIVDPPCVDEMVDIARISGHAAIKRRSLLHALNIKAIARLAANKIKKPLNELNLIVGHLGGGISITPIKKGRMIDTSEALSSGPFTPERSGYLPTSDLIQYVLKNNLSLEEAKKMLVGEGGMYSYLGTKSLIDTDEGYKKNNPKHKLIIKAMAYQIAKEIGAMATALKGKVDKIILTGGAVKSEILVSLIKERISFLVKGVKNIMLFPGEDELRALAQGALRILRKEEKPLDYPQQIETKQLF